MLSNGTSQQLTPQSTPFDYLTDEEKTQKSFSELSAAFGHLANNEALNLPSEMEELLRALLKLAGSRRFLIVSYLTLFKSMHTYKHPFKELPSSAARLKMIHRYMEITDEWQENHTQLFTKKRSGEKTPYEYDISILMDLLVEIVRIGNDTAKDFNNNPGWAIRNVAIEKAKAMRHLWEVTLKKPCISDICQKIIEKEDVEGLNKEKRILHQTKRLTKLQNNSKKIIKICEDFYNECSGTDEQEIAKREIQKIQIEFNKGLNNLIPSNQRTHMPTDEAIRAARLHHVSNEKQIAYDNNVADFESVLRERKESAIEKSKMSLILISQRGEEKEEEEILREEISLSENQKSTAQAQILLSDEEPPQEELAVDNARIFYDACASVGCDSFYYSLNKYDLEANEKTAIGKAIVGKCGEKSKEWMDDNIKEIVKCNIENKEHILTRPYMNKNDADSIQLLQCDDIMKDYPAKMREVAIQAFREISILQLETSPSNFQAVLAIRCNEHQIAIVKAMLKQKYSIDTGANGSFRLGKNWKPCYFPVHQIVRVVHVNNGLIVSLEDLKNIIGIDINTYKEEPKVKAVKEPKAPKMPKSESDISLSGASLPSSSPFSVRSLRDDIEKIPASEAIALLEANRDVHLSTNSEQRYIGIKPTLAYYYSKEPIDTDNKINESKAEIKFTTKLLKYGATIGQTEIELKEQMKELRQDNFSKSSREDYLAWTVIKPALRLGIIHRVQSDNDDIQNGAIAVHN